MHCPHRVKVVIEHVEDGYVAYPLRHERRDCRSAIFIRKPGRYYFRDPCHVGEFGAECVCDAALASEAFIAEAEVLYR